MEAKKEYWDLFDLDGRLVKVIPRGGYKIPANLYHKTVEVIPTDAKGHLFLAQRSFEKKVGAGKYEFPAGSVLSGEEPLEAAKRELQEETGLVVSELCEIGEIFIPGMRRYVCMGIVPQLLTDKITLQEGETIGYKIVTWDGWLELLAQERIETSRCRHYTKAMLEEIEKTVGIASPDVRKPDRKPRRLVKTTENVLGVHRERSADPEDFLDVNEMEDLFLLPDISELGVL